MAYALRISDWSCDVCSSDLIEVSQRFGKQRVGLVRGHCEDAVDDVIGAGLVDGMQVSGFDRRPERPDDDARRVGPQVKRLPVEEGRGWRRPVRPCWLRVWMGSALTPPAGPPLPGPASRPPLSGSIAPIPPPLSLSPAPC